MVDEVGEGVATLLTRTDDLLQRFDPLHVSHLVIPPLRRRSGSLGVSIWRRRCTGR